MEVQGKRPEKIKKPKKKQSQQQPPPQYANTPEEVCPQCGKEIYQRLKTKRRIFCSEYREKRNPYTGHGFHAILFSHARQNFLKMHFLHRINTHCTDSRLNVFVVRVLIIAAYTFSANGLVRRKPLFFPFVNCNFTRLNAPCLIRTILKHFGVKGSDGFPPKFFIFWLLIVVILPGLFACVVQPGGFISFILRYRHSFAFKQWLLDNNCRDVCMESTGKYWVPVFNLLEDSIRVTIANPKWVKAVKGNKDDAKDSKWIGDLFRSGLVPGSFIPCKDIRILREYTRYRFKLVSCKSSEKNRYQNVFTVCNVALDAVVSDMYYCRKAQWRSKMLHHWVLSLIVAQKIHRTNMHSKIGACISK